VASCAPSGCGGEGVRRSSVFEVEAIIARWQSVVNARKIRMKAGGVLAIKHSDRVGHGLHGFSSSEAVTSTDTERWKRLV
jgi:hypothetical protein